MILVASTTMQTRNKITDLMPPYLHTSYANRLNRSVSNVNESEWERGERINESQLVGKRRVGLFIYSKNHRCTTMDKLNIMQVVLLILSYYNIQMCIQRCRFGLRNIIIQRSHNASFFFFLSCLPIDRL